MKYEINCKSDSLTGAALVVKIPENELDKKALYTIQADKPEFILPFRSRSVDGSIEFVYQIGLNNKLLYLTGSRRPKEYAELWSSLLSPLLDCGDWFMKPYSFVLSAKFLYFDKNKKTASYVYIPTVGDSSDYGDLREMAAEVSKIISVADPNLENMALRAVMKDFDPQGFLNMLRTYVEGTARAMAAYGAPAGFDAAGAADRMGPTAQPGRDTPGAATHIRPPAHRPEELAANPLAQPLVAGGREASAAPLAARLPSQPERDGAGEQVPAIGDVLIDIPDKGASKKKSKGKDKKTKEKPQKNKDKDDKSKDKDDKSKDKDEKSKENGKGKGKEGKSKGDKMIAEAKDRSDQRGFFGKKKSAKASDSPTAPVGYGAPAAAQYGAYPPAPMGHGAPAGAAQYGAYPPAPMGRTAPANAAQYGAYPPAQMGRAAPPAIAQYGAYPPAPMGRAAPPAIAQYGAYPPAPMGRATPAPVSQYLAYPPAPMDRTTRDLIAQYLAYASAPASRGAPAPGTHYPAYPPARAMCASAVAPPGTQAAEPPGHDASGAPCADPRDDTQSITVAEGEARLRYIGRGHLPPAIGIQIEEGEIFTIGRYDAAVGGQQSNFEFDRTTKAVSRRHAVIERDAEGYKIIDLASSAGTFLNGQKLTPNTPSSLEQGCHVSFGNCGADYVWEK